MIDFDLIEMLDEGEKAQVKSALRILSSTRILMMQKRRLLDRLATGADSEDIQVVAARVLEYRNESRGLQQLHELGEQYEMESRT